MTDPSEADPWEGTRAERGPERDNPMDGDTAGVFGASPETVGAPRRTSRTGRRRRAPMPRGVLVTIAAILLAVVLASAYVWLS